MGKAMMMELARMGARQRIDALTQELEMVRRCFPDLRPEQRKIKRSTITKARSKKISERMKAYWAARKLAGSLPGKERQE